MNNRIAVTNKLSLRSIKKDLRAGVTKRKIDELEAQALIAKGFISAVDDVFVARLFSGVLGKQIPKGFTTPVISKGESFLLGEFKQKNKKNKDLNVTIQWSFVTV